MRLILEYLLAWVQDKPQYRHLAAIKFKQRSKVKTYSFYAL